MLNESTAEAYNEPIDVTKEVIENNPETEQEVKEEPAQENEENITQLDKEGLVSYLEKLIVSDNIEVIKEKVEQVKVCFYKIHREQLDTLRKKFVEQGGNEADFQAPADENEAKIKELLREYRQKRNVLIEQSEQEKEENLRRKEEIIESIRNLISGEEHLNITFNRFKELQAEWKEIGQVPQSKLKDLWDRYNLHVENFYDYVKINKELRDLDLKKNLEEKTKLCEEAEKLSEQSSVIDAFHHLQQLHDAWREIGPVSKELQEELWERFKKASSIINKRHAEHFETLKAEQEENLRRKEALCVKAEELLAQANRTTRKAWEKTIEILTDIQNEWKSIGFAPKKENTSIYERFRTACNGIYEQRREFFSEIKKAFAENLTLKEKLCEKVEEIQDSEEWKATTEAILKIQEEWKTIGSVAQRQSDAVWKRFRAACDHFFGRKAEFFSAQENSYSSNLQKKQELIAQMQKKIEEGGFSINDIKEFQTKWNAIGFVPVKVKDTISKQYKEALDAMYSTVRRQGNREHIARQAENMSPTQLRDKLFYRVRQLEADIALLENNIGFFSAGKGTEKMIADVQKKIENAKLEMKDTIEQIKKIESNL
ncbi:MAG: DUF349 domain-containing protein [Alistipes sp.]|nr:DUF349 domain-containing protein [Candidatus Alistipes equi]